MTMRLAIISPSFPPDLCGVGDYCSFLAPSLAQGGISVGVWTCEKRASALTGVQLFLIPRPWGWRTFIKLVSDCRAWKPDAFLIQYTPYLFAPKMRGIHVFLPLFIFLLRALFGVPVVTVIHELHYPMQLTLRGILIGVPQFLQFLGVLFFSNKLVFTDEPFCAFYRKLLFWWRDRFHCIPVGTNIPVALTTASEMDPQLAALPEETKVLLHFGRAHPTHLFPYTFAVLRSAIEKFGKGRVGLFLIGVDPTRLEQELKRAQAEDLKECVRALGVLSAAQASNWFKRCDLLLAPFLDGVSTRRTSLMAALAHGKPVVTTRAWSTNRSVPWDSFCAITPAESKEEFVRAAMEVLENPEREAALAQAGKAYFENYFAWPVIAREFQRLL